MTDQPSNYSGLLTQARYDESRERMEDRLYTATDSAPATEDQRAASRLIREAIVTAATVVETEVPSGRNKAMALTALEDALMRGNRGIFAPDGFR